MIGDTSLATAAQRGPLDLAVLEEVALAATRDAALACQVDPLECTTFCAKGLGAPLRAWSGDTSRVAEAQAAFLHRARCNAAARKGRVRGVDGARTRFVKRPVVDVCFTPREIRPVEVAVVVDVLRATSTIVQALAVGYPRVVCCRSVATARDLRTPGRVLAGERACMRVPDFELGNSPAAMATAGRRGEELVLATTNGSPAVVAAARAAERVLVASLLNLGAVVAAVPTGAGVAIVCSGTDGRPALEDVYVAGRLVAALGGVPSDAARVAERVASGYGTPLEPLALSEDATQLRATGQGRDIAWCARESVLEVVPEVWSTQDGASVVGRLRLQP